MQKPTDSQLQKRAPLLAFVLSFSAGCLYSGDPGGIAPDPDTVATLSGARVQLIRHSTSCGTSEARGPVVEVGPGLEYPSDAVAALKTRCTQGLSPGIEVHVEQTAVVFDFSNVAGPGRFPEGEFEGYIIDLLPGVSAPFLLAAALDWGVTRAEMTDDDLVYEPGRLAVNLAGRAFDSGTFLKVDLLLGNLAVPLDSPR
jgi:hypothetical protein